MARSDGPGALPEIPANSSSKMSHNYPTSNVRSPNS